MRSPSNLFSISRPRVRMLAGFVAGVLFASQVLAAAGLCAVKTSTVAPVSETVIAEACDDEDHVDSLARLAATPKAGAADTAPHCLSEDPTAQARAGELSGAAAPAVAPAPSVLAFLPFASVRRLTIADADPPLRPLYTRLSRLLL